MTERQFVRWEKRMRFWGGIFRCHQLPSRSFFFRGRQFPLCTRCSGILLGIALSPLICAFAPENMYISLALIALMALDGFTQLKGWRESNNWLRLLTGIGFSYGVISIAFHIVEKAIALAT